MDEIAPNPDIFKRVNDANLKEVQDFNKTLSVAFTRKHYRSANVSDLSSDQKEIVRLEGSPDWERKFKNTLGEKVTEWLYWKKDYQIQFNEGVLVYAGPIDDQSKMVLRYGVPSRIQTAILSSGRQRVIFWYEKQWKIMVFNENKLVIYQYYEVPPQD